MNLKKIREERAARRLHRQAMAAARHVVGRHVIGDSTDKASGAEVAAVLFGWYGVRIDEVEGLDYLNAVLADRGYPLLSNGKNMEASA